MRKFKLLFVLIGLVFFGCNKAEITSIGEQGNYLANFDFPANVTMAPAKIVLTNRSKNADRYLWDFAGGKILTKDGIQNASVSDKMVPDTIVYELPGEYTVKLTTWQGDKTKTVEKKIVLSKMQPKIVVPENIAVFKEVTFDALAFMYPGQNLTYAWDFGSAGTSTLKSPKVTFSTEGPQTVKLTINDGKETLTTEVIVDVKGELAKTLYFTDIKTKLIYKYKLTTLSPGQPISLGVTIGDSPLGLSTGGNKLFYSEAGLGLRFSGGVAANGDGYIKSYNLDGTGEKLITKNVAVPGYNFDPWMHAIDKDGNIWWTTRNNGVYVINSAATEAAYPNFNFRSTAPGFSSSSHFYSGIKEVGDEIWVSFTGTSGAGIQRYTKAGVLIEVIQGSIKNYGIRQFVVDKANNYIYFSINRSGSLEPGIYRSDLSGNNVITIYNDAAVMGYTSTGFSDQGFGAPNNSNEAIFVTGLDLDVEGGYLYFGYRSRADASGINAPQTLGSGSKSGVMRYKLGSNQTPTLLISGFIPYGIAIDQVKR